MDSITAWSQWAKKFSLGRLDGTYVASGAHDFLIRLWNINEGEYPGSFTERIKSHLFTQEV